MMNKRNNSDQIFQRALKVVPGGIYGHVAPAAGLPRHFPHFCERAKGCRFEDVDGNEWIDFMCGFGAILHGYNHPEIEESVALQRKKGMVFNQPSPLMVDLAETLVERIDFADWAVFAKNGSDLTTWAIRVARESTGRPFVIKAKGAYHGVDSWCDPGHGGRIPDDRASILEFDWNDLQALSDLMTKHEDKVAAVILTPYHHPAFAPSELPADGYWKEVASLCARSGSLLVLDDVRCGGRLHTGGSHRYFGFTPDLAVYSKALGNGYAISACVGKESFRKSSMEVFLTGSCWNDALSMAAALKSLELSERENVADAVLQKGTLLSEGLERVAGDRGLALRMTGPPSMPYPWFEGDETLFKIQTFCQLCAEEGIYFHPHHNWFLSNAHDAESIEQAIAIADKALDRMSEEDGS
jgi:glutamate-1-semialdehyde 2,1-aminomutase